MLKYTIVNSIVMILPNPAIPRLLRGVAWVITVLDPVFPGGSAGTGTRLFRGFCGYFFATAAGIARAAG